MTRMNARGIIGLCSASCFVMLFSLNSWGQEAAKTLTLDECVQVAVTNSTAVLKGTNAVELSGAQVLAAHGQFLPDAVLSGSYTYNNGNNLLGFTTLQLVNLQRSNVLYQVVSSINIYNGYANRSALQAALLTKEMSELSLERAKQQVALDVTQAYLQVVLDKQVVEFGQQNFQTSQKREEQLKELVQVGRRPQSDLYQQQSQTSLDQQFLTNAINKLNIDKILLLQRLRMDPAGVYDVDNVIIDENPLPAEFADETAMINRALGQRADLKSSQRMQDAALWYIKRSRSGYLPRVTASAGAYGVGILFHGLTVNGTDALPTNQRGLGTQLTDQVYGGLSLNLGWNIFDKYVTKSNVAAARINAANARIDFENTGIQISAEVKQALSNYKTALAQTETSEKGLLAANQAFETLTARYAVGSANFIELSNAQNNLLLAKQNRAQAAISLYLQKRAIDFYLGN